MQFSMSNLERCSGNGSPDCGKWGPRPSVSSTDEKSREAKPTRNNKIRCYTAALPAEPKDNEAQGGEGKKKTQATIQEPNAIKTRTYTLEPRTTQMSTLERLELHDRIVD